MSPMKMERIEAGIRAVIELADRFNKHDAPGIARLLSDDCVMESADGRRYNGKAAVEAYYASIFAENPDSHKKVTEVFGLGRRCVLRSTLSSTGGLADGTMAEIFRISNGAIIEILAYTARCGTAE